MRFAARSTSRTLPLLLAAAVLAACGDDGTSPADSYEPQETLNRLAGVVDPLDESGNVFLGLDAATDALYAFGGFDIAPLLRTRPGAGLHGVPLAPPRAFRRSLSEAALVFPAAIRGETLAWDPVDGRYEVDPDRTGAPGQGVRIIYYEMRCVGTQCESAEPAVPLQELGYIELTDEDQGTSERVGIRVVDTRPTTDVELVDYYVDLSGSGTATQGTLRVEAEGFLTAGADPLEFRLAQTFTWSESQDLETLVLDYDFEHDDGRVQFRLDTWMPFESAFGWEDLTLLVELEDGTDEVVIDAEIAVDADIDGEIRHNGRRVMLIGGTDPNPVFTRPDGTQATGSDLATLAAIWDGVIDLLGLSEFLFTPLDLLLLDG